MESLIGKAVRAIGALETFGDGMTPPEQIEKWVTIGTMAASALKMLGAKVEEEPLELEAPPVLQHGWSATPGEVEIWCEVHGIPCSWHRGDVVASFDEKPEDDVRASLKASGFRYVKSQRAWVHKALGRYQGGKQQADGQPCKVDLWRSGERWGREYEEKAA